MDHGFRTNRGSRGSSKPPDGGPRAAARGSVRILLPLFIWLAAIFTLAAACGPLSTAQPAETPAGAYRSPEGLEITPVKVQRDDVAQILGIERWKFQVKPPEPGTQLRFQLELRRPGEEPRVLESLIVQSDGDSATESLVGVYPIHESIFRADQVKLFISGGGGSTSSVIDNPFQAYTFSSPSAPAELQEDGTFKLMAFSTEGHIPSAENSVLVFAIQILNEKRSSE
jgi:hypothetical protein